MVGAAPARARARPLFGGEQWVGSGAAASDLPPAKPAAPKPGIPKYTIRVILIWVIPVASTLVGIVLLVPYLLAAIETPIEVPKAWWTLVWRAESSIATVLSDEAVSPDLAWAPQTLSVVLPCAGEGEFALNTVRSVYQSTPGDILREIIVVDDGSSPSLASSHLSEELRSQYRVRLIRHEETVGLIGSKKDGGDAAVGDIVVFFDCHVAPQPGWHKSFLGLIAANYRRIVVPVITDLDVTRWRQRGGNRGQAKCYLTWDADFKWFDSSDPYVPVLSGGLLGISKRWWNETGGYDEKMIGWGGENLDQSLRSWLCGGEIVMAQDSFVAHMWRVPSDPRTAPRYTVKPGAANANRARAAVAWFGEFGEKLSSFPSLASDRRAPDGGPWYGDIGNILEVKKRLKCRSFAWFMHRFKDVYEDGGLVPSETFGIRAVASGQCLTYEGQPGTSPTGHGRAVLRPCRPGDERQRWHRANRDPSRKDQCCSGLRAWNTDQCLIGSDGQAAKTFVCDIAGRRPDQAWEFTADGQLRHRGRHFLGDGCLEPGAGGEVEERSCPSAGHPASWTKDAPSEPPESLLYKKALEGLEAEGGSL